MSSFSVVAKLKDGGEALLAMGDNPNEALRHARANEIDLYPARAECLLLRQWVDLYQGGYWKVTGTYRPKHKERGLDHDVAA